jgi:hemolysin activation/secretion protein
VEERFYSDRELFRLVHVGAAVFADVGRAWFGSGEPDDLGTLRDVGIGLRLSSSRSADGAMLHVDLAFPLDGEAGIRGSQLVIKSRERF